MQKLMTRPTTKQKITTEIVTITPELATAMMEKNVKNRKPARYHVEKLSHDMANGDWQLTGDAIRFDSDGNLIDGQHRLLACIKADAPFRTIVMYGLDNLAQDVMDTGRARKASDVLSLRGLTNSTRTVSALRVLLAYRDGDIAAGYGAHSNAEIISALERHPNITKSVASVHMMAKTMPVAAISFLHYVATTFTNNEVEADAMIDVFKSGVPAYHGDTIHAYRERMLRRSGTGERIARDTAHSTLHYAWNMFRVQRTTGVFRMQQERVTINGLDVSVL